MKKQKIRLTFKINGKLKYRYTDGYVFEYEGVKLAAHKKACFWTVSSVDSGSSLVEWLQTRKKAIEEAENRINMYGVDRIKKMINMQLEYIEKEMKS